MNAMQSLVAVAVVWLVLGIAAHFYAGQHGIPNWITFAVVPAFLVESLFYIGSGLEEVRRHIFRTPGSLAFLLVSALLPYSIYSIGTGVFRWDCFGLLALIVCIAVLWYAVLPRNTPSDLCFFAFLAIVVLTKIFPRIYLSPKPVQHLEILGQLMWIRLGIAILLCVRGMENPGFGFIPTKREWRIGILNFLAFIPVGLAIVLPLGIGRFQVQTGRAAGLTLLAFFGMLWVVALSEEFFFRGVIQPMLTRWWNNQPVAILCTSVLFGLSHLGFRGFPNWRYVLLTGVAGVFWGHACAKAGGVRASMVAHALVNTAWRLFFS